MERNTAYLPVLNLQTKTPPSSDCAGLDFSSLFGFLTVLNFIKTASQGALLTLQRFVSYTTHWATPAAIRWGRDGTATRHTQAPDRSFGWTHCLTVFWLIYAVILTHCVFPLSTLDALDCMCFMFYSSRCTAHPHTIKGSVYILNVSFCVLSVKTCLVIQLQKNKNKKKTSF